MVVENEAPHDVNFTVIDYKFEQLRNILANEFLTGLINGIVGLETNDLQPENKEVNMLLAGIASSFSPLNKLAKLPLPKITPVILKI